MIRVYAPKEFARVPSGNGFDPAALAADSPCAHIVYRGEREGRCSLWWGEACVAADCGSIGHFYADSPQAAQAVLGEAMALLRGHGCTRVLAPMNGNTWRSYRYATAGGQRPPFLMEPPPALGRDRFLLDAGFAEENRYVSYEKSLRAAAMPDLSPLEARGISIRTLDLTRLEEELHSVYDLAVLAFRENPHYTDLPKGDFVRQYLGYRQMIVPQLVLLAFCGGELVGFLFCIPDYLQGEKPDTVLFKTIAVSPGCRSLGLGRTLMELAGFCAREMGFANAVNALIYRGNFSERFSHGALLREYTLFGRQL